MDIVIVKPGPSFSSRTRLTPDQIPSILLESDIGPGRARRPGRVVGNSEYATAAVERGIECGYLQRIRRGGQAYIRATARYPDDWFAELVGIENKPDLGRPGDLERQLRTDVSLGIFDLVVLCTASHVTGAHLNRIPTEVGVWRFHPDAAEYEAIRQPERLPTDGPGIEVVDEQPDRTDVRSVSSSEKAKYRRRIAERAYGKGWRVPFPGCPDVVDRPVSGIPGLPYCMQQGRYVRPPDACEEACRDGQSVVDLDTLRDEHSPWVRSPAPRVRRQVGLDRFGE